MTKQIPLTKGAFAIVDDADFDRLVQIGRWSLSSKGYSIHWFKDEAGKRKCLYMHRVIMDAPHGLEVDHLDSVRTNNLRSNLRFATRSENCAYRRRMKSNTSGFVGVNRNRGRWEARVKYKNQRVYLGSYEFPEDAALIYDGAVRLLFDEFSRPNFPDIPTTPEIEARVKSRLKKAGVKPDCA